MAKQSMRRRRGPLAPNPELWAALECGPGLRTVLEDFYTRAFEDARLAEFFHGMDKDWVIGKQYNFLSSILTGERTYFGAKPRNAHHWMLIDDELFDHREAMMEECLQRYGLPARLVSQFRSIDEVFRKQIVKTIPRPMRVQGDDIPFDGYEEVRAVVSLLCDGCAREIASDATMYHEIRSGRAYCRVCHQQEPSQARDGESTNGRSM